MQIQQAVEVRHLWYALSAEDAQNLANLALEIRGDATPFFKTPAIVLLDRAWRAVLPFILALVPDLTLIIDFQQSPRVIANSLGVNKSDSRRA